MQRTGAAGAAPLAANIPDLYHYFGQPDFTWNKIKQRNRNPLLSMDIGADGLKTGYTDDSGYAIVGSVKRDGRRLFVAMSGLASESERAEEARKMLDWGMRAFKKTQAVRRRRSRRRGQGLSAATSGAVPVKAKGPLSIFVPITNRDQLIGQGRLSGAGAGAGGGGHTRSAR